MKPTLKKTVSLLASLLVVGSIASAQQFEFPVKVSQNGRYFVDQNAAPVFWLGTTQWELFHGFTQDQAKLILDKSKGSGFSVVQVMLTGVGDGTKLNVYGQKPWLTNDPLTPNEAYFKNVDAVLQMAADDNLIVLITIYHQTCRKYITPEKARPWAKWLARRYKNVPNIVWALVPEAKQAYLPITRDLAAGLREGGAAHLITVHPDPSPYSSSFLHNEDWLDFNTIQTWNAVKLIYPMVTYDYNLKPTKPVVMAEGAYEAGTEYSFDVTPLWVRRQAYYSYLAGGHHAYGHNDSWRIPLLPTWQQALNAPAAAQMGVLKKIFIARKQWWFLVPDQSIFQSGGQISDAPLPPANFASSKAQGAYVRGLGPYASGGKPSANELLHLAARHKDGRWAMIYLADQASFSVDMSKITAPKVNVFWVNPITGDSKPVGQESNTGVKSFSTPDGWEDSVLILEAAEGP